MELSNVMVKTFASVVTNSLRKTAQSSGQAYGKVVEGNMVQLDGSTSLTPCSSTVNSSVGDRVIVQITDHHATIIGNVSSPACDQKTTYDAISQRVEKNGIISEINQSAEEIKISASKISLDGIVTANNNVVIDTSGRITAINATLSGKVTATSGFIGTETSGWRISSNIMRHYRYVAADKLYYDYFMQAADGVNSTNVFAIRFTPTAPSGGSSNANYTFPTTASWFYKFYVNYKGDMVLRYVDETYSNGVPKQYAQFSWSGGRLVNSAYCQNSSGTSVDPTSISNLTHIMTAGFRANNYHSLESNIRVWTDYDADSIAFRGKQMIRFSDSTVGGVTKIDFDYPIDIGDTSIRGTYGSVVIIDVNDTTLYYGVGNTNYDYSDKTIVRGQVVRLYAGSGGGVYLGSSGSTAITSDENLKDIFDIDDRYRDFFSKLSPIAYKYKVGHRTHLGFGARAVEKALMDSGLSTEEFAGLLIDRNIDIGEDELMSSDGKTHFDELYSLRYEEFTALNTLMIQKMMDEIVYLKNQIVQLTG